MPETTSTTPDTQQTQPGQEQENKAEFIKKVSERVWQLLQQDLRRDQERRGKRFGSR